MSKKHEKFVSELNARAVTDIPGIGQVLGGRLERAGFGTADSVFEQYRKFDGDENRFTSWLYGVCGANSRQSSDCFNGVREYTDRISILSTSKPISHTICSPNSINVPVHFNYTIPHIVHSSISRPTTEPTLSRKVPSEDPLKKLDLSNSKSTAVEKNCNVNKEPLTPEPILKNNEKDCSSNKETLKSEPNPKSNELFNATECLEILTSLLSKMRQCKTKEEQIIVIGKTAFEFLYK